MKEISVYPNPASEYTSFSWEIYAELQDGHYRIVDLNGKELMKQSFEETKEKKPLIPAT